MAKPVLSFSHVGIWVTDLPTSDLPAGGTIVFTLRWAPDRWEGQDFAVTVEADR